MELARPTDTGLLITNIDGIGPASADINTTEMATMDGSKLNSTRKTERNVVIDIDFRFADDVEEARRLTYKYFPIKKELTLIITTDNRQSKLTGYVESNEPAIFDEFETTTISIICPDPNLYAADSNENLVVVFSGMSPLFEFPLENNSTIENLIEISSVERSSRKNILYRGESDIGMVITMHALAEVQNITIWNVDTRESMIIDTDKLKSLTGDVMIAGDTIVINTIVGYKSATLVRDGITTNILNCIDRNSTWFQLTSGDNVYFYTAEEGESNLQFQIETKTIYEGV
jgi:hypothetical protein